MIRDEKPFGRNGFDDVWRQQVLAGLKMTPVERLRWLEQAIEFAAKVGALPRRQFIEKYGKE